VTWKRREGVSFKETESSESCKRESVKVSKKGRKARDLKRGGRQKVTKKGSEVRNIKRVRRGTAMKKGIER
jgi:hypothetical protein